MEAVYLLCFILTTSLISFFLTLLLPFHALRRCLRASRGDDDESVSVYEGTVWHDRRRPVRHSFRYTVRYALFDLDRRLYAPRDHLSPDDARRIAQTTGPVFLLTIPPSVGYEQNPLSLYYCYDMEGSTKHLKKCIAEITNTPWGERVTFAFNPDSDLVAKPLHVSPFMDMLGSWKIKANAPGDNLYVSIAVQHPHLGDYFTATLKAKKLPSSLVSDHTIFFWMMPHRVALWIYWHAIAFGNTCFQNALPKAVAQTKPCAFICTQLQAFKLWWKNVAFIQHPRYSNPSYQDDAVFHDQKLRSCQAVQPGKYENVGANRCGSGYMDESGNGTRCFAWREAKWPWT